MAVDGGSGGGGPVIGLNPQPVYQAGRSIADLEGDASSATTRFTSALQDGASSVHHQRLSQALSEFHSTWSVPARQLPTDVAATGNGVSNVGVEGARSDDQSALDLAPAQSTAAEQVQVLNRPISAQ